MRCSCECARAVVNIVELGDGELVYIRLDGGKKYLLNGDGCWRCGSTASCFGKIENNELEVVCEFGFFDEVRSLFLCMLKERLMKLADWLSERVPRKMCTGKLVDVMTRALGLVNLKTKRTTFEEILLSFAI